ncbi:MAG: tripartite tricarboxylate transporter substrate binding protein [Pigmentiphaga sp.]|uniref:Bug family tripartite tricarboxylate transporter substrate binding protein n=1 Tax=Pigmentiphaga sp. TaxID=1977564 RepID=UPI0029A59C49|nr:tripartite tricarboxylate transporter substrate binding protein [Pigmentiphaga sp.]MDX3907454.1 tripartite tricarboxylate transporter substrate binding protein [Pigmentiphaga sp.]
MEARTSVDRNRRRAVLGITGLATGLLPGWGNAASAHDYPSRAIRLINPYAVGSPVDVVARIIAQKLDAAWKQPAVVESRTGAGGTVGAAFVAKSAADGYTLLVSVPTPLTVAPWLFNKLPYDPKTDLVPVWGVLSGGLALVVRKDFPANNLEEFIAYVKAHPNEVRCGSAGIASPQHLAAELFMSRTGTRMIHVPYQGAVPAMTELIGGTLDVMYDAIGHVTPYVRSGKIKALAMLRPKRSPSLPDLPTGAEQGLTGVEPPGSVGIYAPRGTPAEILQRLEATVAKGMDDQETKQKLLDMGMTIDYVQGKEFADLIVRERELFGDIIKAAGISPQ